MGNSEIYDRIYNTTETTKELMKAIKKAGISMSDISKALRNEN